MRRFYRKIRKYESLPEGKKWIEEDYPLPEEEYFKSWAKDFLGFNATMPYDTATPKEAREWVESTIDTLEEGQTYEKIFGNAKYEVYGKPDYMIVLNITADKSKYIE